MRDALYFYYPKPQGIQHLTLAIGSTTGPYQRFSSHAHKPFFLSGGIEPGDEDKLKAFTVEPVAKALFAVDINSRFELAPGIKELDKVGLFAANLKEY